MAAGGLLGVMGWWYPFVKCYSKDVGTVVVSERS